MNANERNQILQHSAGLIFSLQEFLPHDDYTPYDAQKAQEGLMKIHNSNHEVYERDALVHTLENEVEDLENEVEELREEMANACKEKDEENAKLNIALSERDQRIEELEKELDEKYEKDELLQKYKELLIVAKELEEEVKKEKEISQTLFNKIGEDTMIKNWKKKYVNRNPICLLCGKNRLSKSREKYGCLLLRDCFTCEECSKRRCMKSYNCFNGENISLGEMMMTRHDEDREEIRKTLEAYNDKDTPSALLTDYPNLTTDFEIMDMINEWFRKSIEKPNEIFKLISYYRDRLSVCNDTDL